MAAIDATEAAGDRLSRHKVQMRITEPGVNLRDPRLYEVLVREQVRRGARPPYSQTRLVAS
jgi:hypothetical protein